MKRCEFLALAWALALLSAAAAQSQPQSAASNLTCRVSPSAQHGSCGMPATLSNFQSRFECPTEVLVGRPRDLDQLRGIVLAAPHVKATGNGHSFNAEMLCAGTDSTAVNVLTTELTSTLDR